MDTTGLINSFALSTLALWATHKLHAESQEGQSLTTVLNKNLLILKDVAQSNDLETLLNIESMALSLEFENHANSPEERNSIKTALLQLQEAKQSLEVVKNPEGYKTATETYSSKRREAGLPLDSFREFLKSHTTRLTNRLSAPLSVPEKNVLRQRKENLQVAKKLYIALQRTALGIESNKEQGIER